ncbi:hypothetical protein M8J76_016310 [Diaphorina citri]|nr:hypothetical protein M8J75_007926 [Diaphorina citri]KAI5741706.1 hypothetical protein M8J76_016310 [Diaphorina citri]KAI5746528.1 hypothetical protein M8J77_004502 [Diaphorina citri]
MSQSANIIKQNGVCHQAKDKYPYFTKGIIVKGFGRGSKELGIPTANMCDEAVKSLPESFDPGVYYGWSKLSDGPTVYKMVMSIGWNPFYKNKKKSMEVHIIHEFGRDLYDLTLSICVLGYIRPELDFNSLEDLITEIKNDIKTASDNLDTKEARQYVSDKYFSHNADETS